MKKSKLNIRKIAALCGVSTCTASRALSGRAREFRISEATERKVLAVAAKAGYRPNYLAQSLNIGRTYSIGLIFANRVDAYLGGIMEGVEDALRETNCQMVVATCENSADLQKKEIERMLHRQVDGIILYPLAWPKGRKPVLPAAVKSRTTSRPFVIVGRRLDAPRDHVLMADREAGARAAGHFLSAGCRQCAVITHATNCSSDAERTEGFVDTLMNERVVRVRVSLVTENEPSREGVRAMEKADAIFGVNTGTLLAYVTELRKTRDLGNVRFASIGAVQGWDLMGLDLMIQEPPMNEMGRKAVETLLWRLEHPAAASRTVRLALTAL
ncbi:MAG: LacI family DNA-binding transcriptional regulator [Kiritimatiellae bacterium]|nr:LacI family DNA-binding transcriptional regulator [Kiritimatiellia bacterium]